MPAVTYAVGKISSMGADGGAGNYTVFLDVTASDGTHDETASNVLLQVPFGTLLPQFNAKILKAVKDWADGLSHSWNVSASNVYYTPLNRGSAAELLLA